MRMPHTPNDVVTNDVVTNDVVANDVVANDLLSMFLALERLQAVWSASESPVGVIGSAYLTALGVAWTTNTAVDAKRFAVFVNKCKEVWDMPGSG